MFISFRPAGSRPQPSWTCAGLGATDLGCPRVLSVPGLLHGRRLLPRSFCKSPPEALPLFPRGRLNSTICLLLGFVGWIPDSGKSRLSLSRERFQSEHFIEPECERFLRGESRIVSFPVGAARGCEFAQVLMSRGSPLAGGGSQPDASRCPSEIYSSGITGNLGFSILFFWVFCLAAVSPQ